MGEFFRRIYYLIHRRRLDAELENDIAFHREMAARAGRRNFGNTLRMREQAHEAWGWNWLETLLQDVVFGVRAMLRTRALTLVALISLALGIGANTAIFSFLDAMMLRSLPVKNPQQLVKLGNDDWNGITDSFACPELYSYPFYRQFQNKNQVFSDTAALLSLLNPVHGFVDGQQEPELVHIQLVSGTYFQTLGVRAQTGRILDQNDDSSEGDHPVVVVSDGFWKRRLGSDPAVLHHTIKLGKVVFTVVGVAPPEFFGTTVDQAPDAWAPLSMGAVVPPGWGNYKANFSESLYIIGRLKPGVTMEQATANVNVLFRQILMSFPDGKHTQDNLAKLAHTHVALESITRGLSELRHVYSEPLRILMAIVALVLLIACANIANLLLARTTARARELAVRQALGAGRMRILRQLLTESLLLALAGGALGIGFAVVADRVLLGMIAQGPDTVPLDVALNLRLLGFTLAVTVATSLLFGTLPALRATRLQLTESLKAGRGSSAIGGRTPLAKVLVVGQVALSLVLMVAACLFLRTLNNLTHADPGFNKDGVLRLNVDSDSTSYKNDDARLAVLFKQIEDRVSALPGVQAASFSAFTFQEGSWNSTIVIPGVPFDPNVNVRHNIIGNSYFKVMQIPLIAGRQFGPQDTVTSQPVAIISEQMARTFFPKGSPVGSSYSIGSPNGQSAPTSVQVIGIAKDVKDADLQDPVHYIDYMPYTQSPWGFGDFEVRYTGDFGAVADEVQHAIHSVEPALPISNVTTLDAQVARSFADETMIAELSAFFGLVAVFLSCVGLYGLMSYLVGRRTGEIGIRMALGADRAEVGWRVMREIALWVIAGIVIGLPVALEGSRLVQKMLYGMSGNDPLSLTAAVVCLLLAGLAAGYFPARRAARVNPLVALREE